MKQGVSNPGLRRQGERQDDGKRQVVSFSPEVEKTTRSTRRNTCENEEQMTCLWNLQLQVTMRRVAENENG